MIRRNLPPASLGAAAVVTVLVTVPALGDTPDPHDPAASIRAYFAMHRDRVLDASPLAWAGVVLLAGFVLMVAQRLPARGMVRAVATAAGLTYVGYLAASWLAWTTLAYAGPGDRSPAAAAAARLLFIATITASPLAGAALATLLLTVFTCAGTGPLARPWYRLATAAGGLLAAIAVAGHAEAGYLYPDVQQQVLLNVVVGWLLATVVALVLPQRRTPKSVQPTPATPEPR